MSDTSELWEPSTKPPATEQAEQALYARRNYWVTLIEGGAFMGGVAFLNAQTLLPDMIQQLGGSALMIALTPSLMQMGFWIAPALMAHRVARMHRYMPLVRITGIFQRVPYLIAAIFLFFASSDGPSILALVAVAAAPVISGLSGGASLGAWQQLLVRCIPENKRASLFAWRYIISCVLGIIAGFAATHIFREYSLLSAYAILHLIAFGFLVVSYFVFLGTKEPHTPAPEGHSLTLLGTLHSMPRIIVANPVFARYLASRVFRSGHLIIMPFLAIYALEHLGKPSAYLGTLMIAQNVGAIIGNLGAAWLGDRAGGKLVNQLGLGIFIVLAAWAMFASSSTEFIAIFVLMGAAYFAGEVGAFTLMLEILPTRDRISCLAITSLANIPGMLVASWISAAVWKNTHSITMLGIATIFTLLGSILLLHPLKEPRKSLPQLADTR